jgi:hypothetical protein
MLFAAALVLALSHVLAQYRVNTAPTGGARVNPQAPMQVNRGLAGTPMTGSVHYASTSMPMQSEIRYAQWASGATPSEIRTSYNRIGPLSPGGAMDYIPPRPDLTAKVDAGPPQAMGSSAYGMGSVRYAPAPSAGVPTLQTPVSQSLVARSNPIQPPKPQPMPAPSPTPRPTSPRPPSPSPSLADKPPPSMSQPDFSKVSGASVGALPGSLGSVYYAP